MRRMTRALGAALLGAAVPLAGLPAAAAADGGFLRLAHLSPDTPAVDVYVDSVADPAAGVVLEGVDYGTVSDYRDVAPGSYTVAMRAAGAGADTPAVLSTTLDVGAGSARTVAGVGYFADLRLKVLRDDLTLPTPGAARVRVVAAAASAGTLDVSRADGTPLASGLAFARSTEYVEVPGGPTTLRVTPEGGTATDLPLDVAPGSVYSLLVLDRAGGGMAVQPVLDAASPGVVPVGGVAAGAGGAAEVGAAGGAAGGVAGGSALLAAGLGVLGVGLGVLAGAGWAVRGAGSRLGAATVRRPEARMTRHRAPRRAGATAARLALAVAAAAGGVLALSSPGDPPPVTAAVAGPPSVTIEGADRPSQAVPTRLRIPSLRVDSQLALLRTDPAGALVPPEDYDQAGWFTGGPAPGEVGPAVVAGHVDSWTGPAVFARLAETSVGDVVLVDRADGRTLHFTVTGVARYAKADFPTEDVYGPTPGVELRLITCGGEFDRERRSYLDNVVVYATATGEGPVS